MPLLKQEIDTFLPTFPPMEGNIEAYTPSETIAVVFNRSIKIKRTSPQTKDFESEPPNGWMKEVFQDMMMFGWPGNHFEPTLFEDILKFSLICNLVPIHSEEEEYTIFYEGICNGIIWELFHEFKGFEKHLLDEDGRLKQESIPKPEDWKIWRTRQEEIAETWLTFVFDHPEQTQHYLWIHDYHHYLLANIIKQKLQHIANDLCEERQQAEDCTDTLFDTIKQHPRVQEFLETKEQRELSADALKAELCHILENEITLGFFNHIPFPNLENWMKFYDASPEYAMELLDGIMANRVITFHVNRYRENLFAVLRKMYPEVTIENNSVTLRGKETLVDVKPIGIELDFHSRKETDETMASRIDNLKSGNPNRKIILSMSRLDPPKGIVELLEAIRIMLEAKRAALTDGVSSIPDIVNDLDSFTLLLQVIPSRESVPSYGDLKKRISIKIKEIEKIKEEIVEILSPTGDVNEEALDTIKSWKVVEYINTGLPPAQFHTLQRLCDGAIIPPQIDGLNLTAPEIAAAQDGKLNDDGDLDPALLCISRGAGISEIIGDRDLEKGALIIEDPTDPKSFQASIEQILTMPREERVRRNRWIRKQLAEKMDLQQWKQHCISVMQQHSGQEAIRADGHYLKAPQAQSLFAATAKKLVAVAQASHTPSAEFR